MSDKEAKWDAIMASARETVARGKELTDQAEDAKKALEGFRKTSGVDERKAAAFFNNLNDDARRQAEEEKERVMNELAREIAEAKEKAREASGGGVKKGVRRQRQML